jgi:predicted nucleic acid-binding protein
VTRFLLDTNVISETTKPNPDANVIRWMAGLSSMTLPAVGVYEIAAGIERLPASKKRKFLEDWFAELLASDCDVLPFDRDAAVIGAMLETEVRRQRRTVELRDLLILAIAKSRGLVVVTRNVSHFRGFGLAVYDPFSGVQIIS